MEEWGTSRSRSPVVYRSSLVLHVVLIYSTRTSLGQPFAAEMWPHANFGQLGTDAIFRTDQALQTTCK